MVVVPGVACAPGPVQLRAVAAASVVGEAMVAITLAAALLEKFGSDSLTELSRNVDSYLQQVRSY